MALAPWIAPAVLADYVHNVGIRLRRQFRGHTRHPGDAAAIVRACIEACWNGRTFTASPGHFDMFWTRDLSFSVPSLDAARARRRASTPRSPTRSTSGRGGAATSRRRSTTSIGRATSSSTASTRCRCSWRRLRAADADRPRRAPPRPGSRPRSPTTTRMVVDPATGLVRSDRKFSAHRDTVVNRSNAYGNTMVALLAKTIEETGWFASPFERHFDGDYGRLLIDHFWAGDHFRDALGDETVSGEANVWPFYTGVIARPGRRRRRPRATSTPTASATRIRCATRPSRRPEREVWLTRHVLPDYQGSTVWTSLGAMYLQVLRTVDPVLAATETARYVAVDRARRDVLGGHERRGPELGQPALDHDRRGVDALVGDLPRRAREPPICRRPISRVIVPLVTAAAA